MSGLRLNTNDWLQQLGSFGSMSSNLSAPVLPDVSSVALPDMNWGKQVQQKLGDWGILDTLNKDGTKNPGMGGFALGLGQSLMNGFLGMQNYGLAKDSFNESKRQFNMNWDAQKKTTNSALEDRQRARVASNPGAYQSVGEYMKQNGI